MTTELEKLVEQSIYILRDTKVQFKNPCILWSTGKDSTAMLNLCKEAFFGEIPFPAVHIDTGCLFSEIYNFRSELEKLWNLDLIVIKGWQFGPSTHETPEKCCYEHKTVPLKTIIECLNFDAVIVSIRRDEHYIRSMERVSSPRDMKGCWHLLRPKEENETGDAPFITEQDAELWNIYASDFGKETHHVRRHPLLHWTELEVWQYTLDRQLPVNPLYYADYVHQKYRLINKRYRSLGCMPCTEPVDSDASTIDEIIKELETTRIAERSGRKQDMELRRLRTLGYM